MALGYKVGEQEIKATIYNKEEIKKILRKKIKIKGRNLKIREIEEIPELPSLPTIYKIFEVNKIKDLYIAIEELLISRTNLSVRFYINKYYRIDIFRTKST